MAKPRFNQVILVGALGRDPEIRFTTSGLGIATLSVATNDGYYSTKENKWIDNTTWHNVEQMSKKDIESVGALKKGDLVLIVGSKAVDSWEDREGNKRYKEKVKASIICKVVALEDVSKVEPNYPGPSNPYPEADDDIPF